MASINRWALRGALSLWGVCAYLLACDTDLTPRRFSVSGLLPDPWGHWQIWLLAGIVALAVRELFSELRCNVCASRENLLIGRWLLTHRLICHECRELEMALEPPVAKKDESVPAEYADLFEALK